MKHIPNLCAQGGGPYLHADIMLGHFMHALNLNGASQNQIQKLVATKFPQFNYFKIKDGDDMRVWLEKAKTVRPNGPYVSAAQALRSLQEAI